MIFKEEKKVGYTPKQSVKSNSQANGDVVSKNNHNKENIMDFNKNLEDAQSIVLEYSKQVGDTPMTAVEAASNLYNTLNGSGYNSNYLRIQTEMLESYCENNVIRALLIKLATGRTSNLVRGRFSTSGDVNAKVLASIIEEQFLLKSQKNLDPALSAEIDEVLKLIYSCPILEGQGDALILSKVSNSLIYGVKLLTDKYAFASNFIISCVFEYNKNVELMGKEAAELVLANKLITAGTTKVTNDDGSISFETDFKIVAIFFEMVTNFYVGLVINKLATPTIEGLTKKNVNDPENELIRKTNTAAYNEYISQKKDGDAKYSLFRSMFLKTLRDLFSGQSVTLYSSSVVLNISKEDLFNIVIKEKNGKLVRSFRGIIARYMSNYSDTKLSYLMANTATDICGWANAGYDIRKKAYAVLEANKYEMPAADEKGNIVFTNLSDLKDFALYNYFNQPIAKGEKIGALAHIYITRETSKIFAEAIDNGAPVQAATELAIEWVQQNVFCYTASMIEKGHTNSLEAQEMVNDYFGHTIKKLPEITIGGHKALFIRKFKEQGVQKAFMVKLPEDYNSGVLSNYSTIAVGLNKFTAEIMTEALTRGIEVYVQEATITTTDMVKVVSTKKEETSLILG